MGCRHIETSAPIGARIGTWLPARLGKHYKFEFSWYLPEGLQVLIPFSPDCTFCSFDQQAVDHQRVVLMFCAENYSPHQVHWVEINFPLMMVTLDLYHLWNYYLVFITGFHEQPEKGEIEHEKKFYSCSQSCLKQQKQY